MLLACETLFCSVKDLDPSCRSPFVGLRVLEMESLVGSQFTPCPSRDPHSSEGQIHRGCVDLVGIAWTILQHSWCCVDSSQEVGLLRSGSVVRRSSEPCFEFPVAALALR
ncbi:hypothetical protein NDU88_004447 [Pleurodeles waltl]|uniref:Uncharacterized protein n=1 Tax=Pleurodeles waltl TaxID=8319 RepID=A0AAV7LI85_PLEWA|nr:hypothetical protein NDU88_004447 [Pleurodeles waltl]